MKKLAGGIDEGPAAADVPKTDPAVDKEELLGGEAPKTADLLPKVVGVLLSLLLCWKFESWLTACAGPDDPSLLFELTLAPKTALLLAKGFPLVAVDAPLDPREAPPRPPLDACRCEEGPAPSESC